MTTPPDWYVAGLPHAWRPYTQMKTAAPPLPVVRTEGVRIELADGRTLIDGIASWWTVCHGYNPPHLRAAIENQLAALPHVMFGGLTHAPALRLAKRLAELLPGDLDHVFFAESGSVAVEVAMKMALQYWRNRGVTGRTRFVSFLGGYHGDTLATMAVCDPAEGLHREFGGILPPQHVVPLPVTCEGERAFEAFLAAHRHEVAAVIVEPLLQGAGGMRMHGPEVLSFLRGACDRQDVLLVFDEIATGFGRTGTLFACEQAEVVPDVVTLSKALTGGMLPLSAAVARRHVFEAFLSDDPAKALVHGPTYMANPLGCAAALASLELFDTAPRLAQVAAISTQLRSELEACRRIPGVVDVRTLGACGAVQLDSPGPGGIDFLRARLAETGVWVRPFGDVVYLMPAFVVSSADLSVLTAAVQQAVAAWSRSR